MVWNEAIEIVGTRPYMALQATLKKELCVYHKSNEKSFNDFKCGETVRFASWKVHNVQALELRTWI